MTQEEVWQRLVFDFSPTSLLGFGMSRELWERHLEGTTPLRVEEDDSGMAWFIQAKDEYSSRWLGDRLAQYARRHLMGIVNKPVKFVIFTMGTNGDM